MRSSPLFCTTALILATTLGSSAHATVMDLLVEGVMIDREGGSSYGGGYTMLDLFQPGDPFSIKLRLDTAMLAAEQPPIIGVPGSRYIESGNGPVVVDGSLQTDDIPVSFSLIGGPTFPPGYGECFEAPDCINDLEPPSPSVDPTLQRNYESVNIVRTISNPSALAFEWRHGASFSRGFDPGFNVPDPFLEVLFSFNVLDAGNASFADLASNGVINYNDSGQAFGGLSIVSDEPLADGKGLWRFQTNFDVSRVTFTPVAAVPEVETWVMLGLGGLILTYRLHRRGKQTQPRLVAC